MSEQAGAPGRDTPLGVLWRRRWIVVATVAIFAVAAAIVSKTLEPVYSTSARLLIVQSSDRQSFDSVQAAQVTARTYADILDSPNLAREVAERLGGISPDEVEDATTFEPIPETQLLRIVAEWPTAAGAVRIANTYADVFTTYAARRLRPTTEATVSLADAAALPEAPARPRPMLYTLLAALLGLGAGIGLAFLRDRFDTRLEGADEVERTFGLPTLARIPRRGASQDALTRFAEAFRMLRVAVAFSSPTPPASILVTSSTEGEGKTTTARQLALAHAEAGQRVIAVEADVYRPALRRALRMPEDGAESRGLTSYLLGHSSLDEVIERTGAPNVGLIGAGPTPLSLASLLETDRGRTFVEDLEARADVVIIDCPPIAPRADAAVLAARADATIVVVDTAVSARPAIDDALRALRAVHANILGIVLNRTAVSADYSPYHATDERRAGAAREPSATVAD